MAGRATRAAPALAGLLLALAGCASLPPGGPVPAAVSGAVVPAAGGGTAAPAPPIAPRTRLAHVPFHPQQAFRCGPAALASALGAQGSDVTPESLAQEVFLPARHGSLQAEMMAGARRHGALATRIPPRLEALLQEVAAGHPVVVLQNLGLAMAPLWHYAIVVGYDLPARELLLHSGSVRDLRLSLSTFDHTWARSGRWAFVVLPPGRWPVTADGAAAAEAAVGFERVASPRQAAIAYAAAADRWPDLPALAIGLGNARHAAGDLAGAAAAFDTAARRHDSAPAWINLALTRRAMGDADGARSAAAAAVAAAVRAGASGWLQRARETAAALQ